MKAYSPCCGSAVYVTKRRSKQLERPRNHRCSDCGKPFTVNMKSGILVAVK